MTFETQTLASPSGDSIPICLEVKGLGPVPSKKNKHIPVHHRGGEKLMVLLKPEVRKWIKQCEDSFVSQLFSVCLRNGGGTLTEPSLRLLMQSLPPDDACLFITRECIRVEWVEPGHEGATITIERI